MLIIEVKCPHLIHYIPKIVLFLKTINLITLHSKFCVSEKEKVVEKATTIVVIQQKETQVFQFINLLNSKIMANETTKPEVREYENVKGRITKVMIPDAKDARLTFVLNVEFLTIDAKDGKEKATNMFGLNIYNVVNQVADFVDYIQLADTIGMGGMVNPQIIALALTNAEVEIAREFHRKGEKREHTDDVYANDCIVTKIVSVTPHIKPMFESMLQTLITTMPTIKTKNDENNERPNPFNM